MSMFDQKNRSPLSALGPGFTAGMQLPDWSPNVIATMSRGIVPVVFSIDPRVKTFSNGRMNGGWVPADTLLETLNRGASYSAPPVSARGTTNGSGLLTLTLTAPAETSPPATFQGRDYRFAAFAVDITSNNNTNNGQMVIDIAGTFEDGDTYTQQITALPSIVGTARYYVISTQEQDGGPYPELVILQNQRLAVPRGSSVTLDFGSEDVELATIITDLRGGSVPMTWSFNGGAGLDVFVTALKPANQLWDDFKGFVNGIIDASKTSQTP